MYLKFCAAYSDVGPMTPDANGTMWWPVVGVQRIRVVGYEEFTGKIGLQDGGASNLASLRDLYGDVGVHTSWPRPVSDGEPFATLLAVDRGPGLIAYLLVDYAWLLSERGDTIERIAP